MTTTKAADVYGLIWLVAGSVLLPVIGWGIGLWMLWRSMRWTFSEKVLGTVLWPAAIFIPGFVFESGGTWSVPVVFIWSVPVAFVAVVARLAYRLTRPDPVRYS